MMACIRCTGLRSGSMSSSTTGPTDLGTGASRLASSVAACMSPALAMPIMVSTICGHSGDTASRSLVSNVVFGRRPTAAWLPFSNRAKIVIPSFRNGNILSFPGGKWAPTISDVTHTQSETGFSLGC